jgi:hypothetical protein
LLWNTFGVLNHLGIGSSLINTSFRHSISFMPDIVGMLWPRIVEFHDPLTTYCQRSCEFFVSALELRAKMDNVLRRASSLARRVGMAARVRWGLASASGWYGSEGAQASSLAHRVGIGSSLQLLQQVLQLLGQSRQLIR